MSFPISQPVRVIEAPGSGIAATYAGWLLAKMGADVARYEDVVPSGDPISLALQALAIGKRTVTSKEELRAELGTGDILLTDDPVGLVSFAGELSVIASRHPRLIVAVHSVFGLDGPNAGVPAEAIDAQAVSGVAWALGDPAREPLTLPPGIVEHEGGAMLAAGALLAHFLREQGQQVPTVDIALSEVLASYVAGNCRFYVHHGMAWHRSGTRASSSGGAYPFTILPCSDGEVCLCGRTKDEWRRLVAVMGNPEWTSNPRYQSLRAMGRDYPDEVDALIRPWLADHTMAELEKIAIDNNLIMSPVRSVADVIGTLGFVEDGFLAPQELPAGELIVPALPFRITADREKGAADLASQMLTVKGSRCRPLGGTKGPLEGLRIIDFGWVWSAPWVATILGELGAEVIKIEHGKRPDTLRLSGRIFRGGEEVSGPTDEMSPMYHQINHGKLGITLNAKEPRAVELIMELIASADLVIENMSPGSLERSGLGYEQLRGANPKIVMLAMSAAGQFGSLSKMRAYAPTMSSFAGMEALVGYAGESPIGALNVALGDPNASVHGLLAAIAALRFAASTGQGCYIDLSQVEALAGTLRPYLIQGQLEGRQPPLSGNRHPAMAPHGIYPASGTDRWLTIAVASDASWQALASLAKGKGWASDLQYASVGGRLADVTTLDRAIGDWTKTWDREELVTALRAAGVPASPVQTADEMWGDPHFAARGMVHDVELPFYGTDRIARAPWRFSTFAPCIDRPGPTTGEHNYAVLGGQLGLTTGQIDELIASGIVG